MSDCEHDTRGSKDRRGRQRTALGARLTRSRALQAAAAVGVAAALGATVASSAAFGASSTRASSGSPTSGGGFQYWGGSTPFGGYGGSGHGNDGPGGSERSDSEAAGAPSNTAALAASVSTAVVDINTTLSDGEAAGTGIVLTSTGLILTNNHVIEQAQSIKVTDVNNGKTYGATVVGYDRGDDIAVLQLVNASGLTTATIGNSSSLAVGDGVVGIGNAGGVGGAPSYAGGEVTATGQTITAGDETSPTDSETLTGLIGTNADIEPGDSGGPLVNSSGKVVGIDTAGSSSEGTFGFTSASSAAATEGYAIPINRAMAIERQIVAGQSSTSVHIGKTAFLGVEVAETSSAPVSEGGPRGYFGGGSFWYGNASAGSASTTSGAFIEGVLSGTPAASAGLSAGDTITAIDGHAVSSPASLTTILGGLAYDAKVSVTYVDASGSSKTVSATLVSGPPQ